MRINVALTSKVRADAIGSSIIIILPDYVRKRGFPWVGFAYSGLIH